MKGGLPWATPGERAPQSTTAQQLAVCLGTGLEHASTRLLHELRFVCLHTQAVSR